MSACFTMETSPSCFTYSGGAFVNQADHASTWKVSPYSSATQSVVYFGTQAGELFRVTTTLSGGLPTAVSSCEFNMAGLPSSNLSSIDIGTSEAQLLLTFSNFGVDSVWETLNATSTCTATWNDRDDNSTLPDIPVNWGLYNPVDTKQVLLATDAGLWGTTDITAAAAAKDGGPAAPTWVFGTTPTVRVDQLVWRALDGQVMVVTHGRGVWTGQFGELLPVELTAFEAVADGDAVQLTWETASETNNAGFEIQHRYFDGDYAAMGYVEGHGTTLEARRYEHRIENLEPGRHTFRLKQIDYDGTFEVHPAVEVFIEQAEAFRVSEAFPNPFAVRTQVEVSVAAAQRVTVEVIDVRGRRVATLHDGLLEANRPHRFAFGGEGLPSGLYFYRITGEHFATTKSVLRVR